MRGVLDVAAVHDFNEIVAFINLAGGRSRTERGLAEVLEKGVSDDEDRQNCTAISAKATRIPYALTEYSDVVVVALFLMG